MTQNVWDKARSKAYESFEDIGVMASFVGMIDGKVVAKILDKKEILALFDLYDTVEEIPKEYTFYFE